MENFPDFRTKAGKALWIFTALVTGVLLFAAFPPFDEPVGVLFALVPLLAAVRMSSPGKAALLSFFAGLVFFTPSLWWIISISENGGPLPLVIAGWLALSAYCAGFFALFGCLDSLLWRKVACRSAFMRIASLAVFESALWAGCEYLRGNLFGGFAWNFLGVAAFSAKQLHSPSVFAPAASLGGVYLVSAMVVLINGIFATAVSRQLFRVKKQAAGSRAKSTFLRIAETALPFAIAVALVVLPSAKAPSGFPLKVAVAQPNIPCFFKPGAQIENPSETMENILKPFAGEEIDLMLWPESAMSILAGPVDGRNALGAAKHFMALSETRALIAGGDLKEISGGKAKDYNAAAFYEMRESNALPYVQTYKKQHLVPFGEFIPLDKLITPLQKLSPIGTSLYPGEGVLFAIKPAAIDHVIKIAPLICYEDTDENLARSAAADGASLIALITNDSWFSGSCEALQHFRQAVLRSAETGLPVIRCGNSGVSGVIHPDGSCKILEAPESEFGKPEPFVDRCGAGSFYAFVEANPEKTFYTKAGNVPLAVVFILTLCLIAGFSFKDAKRLRAGKSVQE